MPNDLSAGATRFGLALGSPLTEANSVTVTASVKYDPILFQFDLKMRAVQRTRRHSITKFDSAHETIPSSSDNVVTRGKTHREPISERRLRL